MSKKGYSQKGLFGNINHYDSKGKKMGESRPGMFGGYTNYDSNGKKVGHSSPGMFGGYNNYDNNGKKIGHISPGMFGGYNHYDNKGNNTRHSSPGLFESYNHYDSKKYNNTVLNSSGSFSGSNQNTTSGCYIATCVYGSYDCPEVWILRRFRDYKLSETIWGRVFIKSYYMVSPIAVKMFGNTKIFKLFWGKILDKIVAKLKLKGYEDKPYKDIEK